MSLGTHFWFWLSEEIKVLCVCALVFTACNRCYSFMLDSFFSVTVDFVSLGSLHASCTVAKVFVCRCVHQHC